MNAVGELSANPDFFNPTAVFGQSRKCFFVLMFLEISANLLKFPCFFGEDFSLLGVTLGNTRGALELVWSLTSLKVLYVKLCIYLYECVYIYTHRYMIHV